ncbi:MAG: peroxiredoxin [Pirellulales bacterium]|nr:peroxiredoxin [Pirellulales bacterium]
MSAVGVGDPAPDFTRQAHTGEMVTLGSYRGRSAVVLFFYPKDGTPVCTKEACGFRDSHEAFAAAGAVVIGVSADSPESHRRFAAERGLPYLLLSDADGSLRSLFGVPKTMAVFPGRVTYVIDKGGIVRHITNVQLSAGRHIDEALDTVKQLVNQ